MNSDKTLFQQLEGLDKFVWACACFHAFVLVWKVMLLVALLLAELVGITFPKY